MTSSAWVSFAPFALMTIVTALLLAIAWSERRNGETATSFLPGRRLTKAEDPIGFQSHQQVMYLSAAATGAIAILLLLDFLGLL